MGIWIKLLPLYFCTYLFIVIYCKSSDDTSFVRPNPGLGNRSVPATLCSGQRNAFFSVFFFFNGLPLLLPILPWMQSLHIETPSGTTIAGTFHLLQSWKWNLWEGVKASVSSFSFETFPFGLIPACLSVNSVTCKRRHMLPQGHFFTKGATSLTKKSLSCMFSLSELIKGFCKVSFSLLLAVTAVWSLLVLKPVLSLPVTVVLVWPCMHSPLLVM